MAVYSHCKHYFVYSKINIQLAVHIICTILAFLVIHAPVNITLYKRSANHAPNHVYSLL